jgi:DNA-binding LacI/PurR family transcriptional regulator
LAARASGFDAQEKQRTALNTAANKNVPENLDFIMPPANFLILSCNVARCQEKSSKIITFSLKKCNVPQERLDHSSVSGYNIFIHNDKGKSMTNIKQVAAYAGLSPSCVSKYFKDKDSVRENSRKQIENAIAALNYTPSSIARSLRGGKFMTIKVILPTIRLPFFGTIFEELHKFLQKAGYNLILQTVTEGKNFMPDDFIFTDGVIASFLDSESSILQLREILKNLKKPLVLMQGSQDPLKEGSVTCNIGDGVAEISRYLIANGRKHIAFVGGKRDSLSSRERFKGFRDTVPPDCRYGVFRHDFTMEWGYSAGQMMLDLDNHPDAVVCENDYIAAGVIKCMLAHGIMVPSDVWVTGFDDSSLARMYAPSISSFEIPSVEMSEAAAGMMLDALRGGSLERRRFLGKIILRESSTPIQGALNPSPLNPPGDNHQAGAELDSKFALVETAS